MYVHSDLCRPHLALSAIYDPGWFVGPQFAVTPDLQYLINPANNPDEKSIWVFGVRARVSL